MSEISDKFMEKIFRSIRDADTEGLLSDKGLDELGGLSGKKTLGALQRLIALFAGDPSACYLEIGVYQGLTLLSNAVQYPDFPCFGIDNFSLLDPRGENLDIVKKRMSRLKVKNAVLINEDFEDAFAHLDDTLKGRKIAVYFVDGAHNYRSQFMGLVLAMPFLHENAVILIDDANFQFVRQSTRDFLIAFPDFKMIFESYSPAHPANMAPDVLAEWEESWLNGINILVRDRGGRLPDMTPEVRRNGELYVNEWLVHRLQMAEIAPEAVELAQAICWGDAKQETERRQALLQQFESLREKFSTRFPDRNTYSEGLTGSRFNEIKS